MKDISSRNFILQIGHKLLEKFTEILIPLFNHIYIDIQSP